MDRVHTFITNMLFYDQSPALMSVLNASDAISEMWLSLHRVRRCWPCLRAVDRSHRSHRPQSQGANLLFQPPTTASTNATTSSDGRSSTRNSTSANGSPPSTSNFETKSRLLVFFLTQLLARHFPGQSLSTFSFQCMAYLQLDHLSLSLSHSRTCMGSIAVSLAIQRMQFLDANPADFVVGEVLGVGAEV